MPRSPVSTSPDSTANYSGYLSSGSLAQLLVVMGLTGNSTSAIVTPQPPWHNYPVYYDDYIYGVFDLGTIENAYGGESMTVYFDIEPHFFWVEEATPTFLISEAENESLPINFDNYKLWHNQSLGQMLFNINSVNVVTHNGKQQLEIVVVPNSWSTSPAEDEEVWGYFEGDIWAVNNEGRTSKVFFDMTFHYNAVNSNN